MVDIFSQSAGSDSDVMEQIEDVMIRLEEKKEGSNMFLYDGRREKEAYRRSPQSIQRSPTKKLQLRRIVNWYMKTVVC
jgi:hypothetical protein